MDFGFSSDSEIRHAVKSFGFFHSISIQWRILITGFERASVWFQATLAVSSARLVPVGNSSADHSGNEHGGGGGRSPGVRSSRGSWERVVGEVWETVNPHHDLLP